MALANPERGEVALTVERNGSTVEYALKLSINAACALEKKRGQSVGDIFGSLGTSVSFDVVRDVLWMLLQKHHAREFPVVEKVGDLIDEVGLEAIVSAMGSVMSVNAPEGAANPPTAAAVTGDVSSSMPAA